MFKDEKGGTLVLVIIIMAVFAIIGTAFITATTGEGIQAINHQHQTQAHYNARSGAYIGLEWLKGEAGVEWINESSDDISLSGDIKNGLVQVEDIEADINLSIIKETGNTLNPLDITISSTGRYRGENAEVIEIKMSAEKNGNEGSDIGKEIGKIDMAIFSKGENIKPVITVNGQNKKIQINGAIGIRSTEKHAIEGNGALGNQDRIGTVYIPVNEKDLESYEQVVKGGGRAEIKSLYEKINKNAVANIYPQITMPPAPKIGNNENTKLIENKVYDEDIHISHGTDNIVIKNTTFNNDVYIDAGSKNVDIIKSTFKGNVYIKGDNIFIKENSNFLKEGEVINTIVLDATGNIQTEDTVFDGNVYMELHDEHIQIDVGTNFGKNLFINGGGKDKKVQFEGEVEVGGLLYAPDRDLIFDEYANIGYAVVANTMIFNKSVRIDFDPSKAELSSIPSYKPDESVPNQGSGSSGFEKKEVTKDSILDAIEKAKWLKEN